MPTATAAPEVKVLWDRPDTLGVNLTHFVVGGHLLRADHLKFLQNEVGPRLRSGGSVTLVGLASRTGSAATNKALSERRTNSVLQRLRIEGGAAFKVNNASGSGEEAARLAGQRDGTEDPGWRAVMLIWWKNPDPPPVAPPPEPPPMVQRWGAKSVTMPESSASANEPGHNRAQQGQLLRHILFPSTIDNRVKNEGAPVYVPEDSVLTAIRFKLRQANGMNWYDVDFTWSPRTASSSTDLVPVYSGGSVEDRLTQSVALEVYAHPGHWVLKPLRSKGTSGWSP